MQLELLPRPQPSAVNYRAWVAERWEKIYWTLIGGFETEAEAKRHARVKLRDWPRAAGIRIEVY